MAHSESVLAYNLFILTLFFLSRTYAPWPKRCLLNILQQYSNLQYYFDLIYFSQVSPEWETKFAIAPQHMKRAAMLLLLHHTRKLACNRQQQSLFWLVLYRVLESPRITVVQPQHHHGLPTAHGDWTISF